MQISDHEFAIIERILSNKDFQFVEPGFETENQTDIQAEKEHLKNINFRPERPRENVRKMETTCVSCHRPYQIYSSQLTSREGVTVYICNKCSLKGTSNL